METTKEMRILALENRINTLKGRTTQNDKIVKKLERKIRELSKWAFAHKGHHRSSVHVRCPGFIEYQSFNEAKRL